MKSRVTRILSIGIALAAVAAVQAKDNSMAANVPFAFYMGSAAMPQGAYAVNELAHGAVVVMRSPGGTKSVTTHEVLSNRSVEPARLVFHCYGGNCFLAEVWTGDTIGEGLAASPREKEMAQRAMPTLAVIRLALH